VNTQPNILLILTDQQHADTIGALGQKHVQTPAIDELVHTGTSFTQSYCANPVCSPSRSSIFTSRTTSETNVWTNGRSIRPEFPTMGEHFHAAGYDTAYAGKWHVPACYPNAIEGFRVLSSGIGHQGTVSDPLVTDGCVNYLHGRDTSKPFLMVASYMQPHDICEWLRLNRVDTGKLHYPELADAFPPLPDNFNSIPEPLPEAIAKKHNGMEPRHGNWSEEHFRYYIWSYLRHVEMVDAELARLLAALDATDLRRDTVILFTSDHGEGMANHAMTRKGFLYDESARVPFVVSGGERVRSGVVDGKTLASGIDIFPTLCDFAGIESPSGAKGVSLIPALEGGEMNRPFVAAECSNNQEQMIRSPRYKYIAYKDDPVEQLFDMQDDPGETRNLSVQKSHEAVLEEHRDLLSQWIGQLDLAPDLPEECRWPVD
jgi:arylsulfatase A-like enzyme